MSTNSWGEMRRHLFPDVALSILEFVPVLTTSCMAEGACVTDSFFVLHDHVSVYVYSHAFELLTQLVDSPLRCWYRGTCRAHAAGDSILMSNGGPAAAASACVIERVLPSADVVRTVGRGYLERPWKVDASDTYICVADTDRRVVLFFAGAQEGDMPVHVIDCAVHALRLSAWEPAFLFADADGVWRYVAGGHRERVSSEQGVLDFMQCADDAASVLAYGGCRQLIKTAAGDTSTPTAVRRLSDHALTDAQFGFFPTLTFHDRLGLFVVRGNKVLRANCNWTRLRAAWVAACVS